jgi:transcriptional regulator with XRE-family HTH domain
MLSHAGSLDFAVRLRLALGQANLGRAAVAREVGVDKSVVTRWLSGQVRPAEHNLIALTELIAQRLPGFCTADWTRPEAAFNAALRILLAPVPGPATAPGLLGNAVQWAAAQGLDKALTQYGGLWLFMYDSVRVARPFAVVGEFRLSAGVLEAEFRDDHNWHGRGPAFALNNKLWVAAEEVARQDSFGFAVFWGSATRRAEVLDGFAMVREFAPTASPGVTHMVGFRLADLLADPVAAQERWAACVARVGELNMAGWEDLLEPALFERMPASVQAAPTTMRLPVEHTLAISDFDLAAAEPADGLRRRTLKTLRALFSEALSGD